MITTVQLAALLLATCAAQACWASYCSAGTMVSRRSLPFTTGWLSSPASGICSPLVPICTCWLPDFPARSELYSCSIPAAQVARGAGAGEAEDVGRGVAVRVGPGVARGERDAGQVLGLDRVPVLRGH